eukprot:Gb_25748 [translate_table: standard]
MELSLYSFEGTMELHEWFQRMEEYFEYTRFQKEHDKALIASLHLTGQAYTWEKRQYKYWEPSFPWDTFENFKEELEFKERWKYKERKALELEYYDYIEEEALEFKDDKYKCKDVDEEQDEEPNEQPKEEEKYDLPMEELEENKNSEDEKYNVEENEVEKAPDTKEYYNMLVKDRQEEKKAQQEQITEDQTCKPMEDDQEYGHVQVRISKTNNVEKEEETKIQLVVEVLEISRAKLNIDEHYQRKSDEVAKLMQEMNRDGIPPKKEDIEDIKVFEESPSFGPSSKVGNMEQVEALVLEMEENQYEAPKDLYHIIFNGLLLDSSTVMTTIGLAMIKALFQRDGHGECWYHQLGLVTKYSSIPYNHNDCIVLVSTSVEMGRQLRFKLLYDVNAQQGEMKILPNFANSRYKYDLSYDVLREILMFPYGEIKLEDKVRDKTPPLSINGFVVGNFMNGQYMT